MVGDPKMTLRFLTDQRTAPTSWRPATIANGAEPCRILNAALGEGGN